jgi:hypothetical protein
MKRGLFEKQVRGWEIAMLPLRSRYRKKQMVNIEQLR